MLMDQVRNDQRILPSSCNDAQAIFEADSIPRDTWFNPYRAPKTDRARAVVNDVTNQVQNFERFEMFRKRARRPRDQQAFEDSVSAIVCDLIHFHLLGQPGGLVVTRSNTILGKRSRYRPPIYNQTFPVILDRLASPQMAFIEQYKGHPMNFEGGRCRTTIRLAWRLVNRIRDHGLTFDDLTTTAEGELIVLKRSPHGFWDEADMIEYGDTEATIAYREEMRAINSRLDSADLDFDQETAPALKVDLSDRRLRRIFTRESFESGGRLFGGFWQPLPKVIRTQGLRISGEPVAVLDYSQMNPLIAYGLANAHPPSPDVYRVRGFEEDRYRPGIKKLFNAMLFATKPLTRMPGGVREYFPRGVSVAAVTDAIAQGNPGLRDLFFVGIGHYVQFLENQILVRVLLQLREKGIVALPIHDAVAVPASAMRPAREVMIEHFRATTGLEVRVHDECVLN
jgi:hypothetical protein